LRYTSVFGNLGKLSGVEHVYANLKSGEIQVDQNEI
jgi:hypothetical protein